MLCIYCNQTNLHGSNEHIILNALGGRKKSKIICCTNCNNEYGNTIDKALTEQFIYFCNALNIKTGRNKSAPTLRGIPHEKYGKINIRPGGIPELAKSYFNSNKDEEKKKITISIEAKSIQDIENFTPNINNILKNQNKTIEDMNFTIKEDSSFVSGKLNFKLSFGESILRSISKMMFNFLYSKIAHKNIERNTFIKIINYIKKGELLDNNWIEHDYFNEFPETKFMGTFQHRLFVFTVPEERLAYGLLELFGSFRFSCILSDCWSGSRLGYSYIIDPITGKQLTELDLDPPQSITKHSLLSKSFDPRRFKLALETLLSNIHVMQYNKSIYRLIDDVVNSTLQNNQIITETDLYKISSRLAHEFVKLQNSCKYNMFIDRSSD